MNRRLIRSGWCLAFLLLFGPKWSLRAESPGDRPGGQPARVVGGFDAQPGAYPWVAAVVEAGAPAASGVFCGGTLIRDRWVLTAAHCVGGEGPSTIEVLLGRLRLSDPGGERLAVSRIVVHPGYDDVTSDLDAALLELEIPSSQPPIGLLTPSQADLAAAGVEATVAGWGVVNPETEEFPDHLQAALVDIVSNTTCNQPKSFDGAVSANMLCAGFAEGGVDACSGDSGGPLMVPDGTGYRLAGIVSWGSGCALPYKYGVYSRVTSVWDWIQLTIGEAPPGNRPPVVAEIEDRVAVSGSRVNLVAVANDPDGDTLSFQWTQTGGPQVAVLVAEAGRFEFRAPRVAESTQLTFRLDVGDGDAVVSRSFQVTVLPAKELLLPGAFAQGASEPRAFLGVGLFNPVAESLAVSIEARALNGSGSRQAQWPTALPAKGQVSFLTRDLALDAGSDNYLRLTGDRGEVRGMFLAGSYDGRRMDGIGGEATAQTVAYFPLFEGSAEAVSLFVANPDPETGAALRLVLYAPDGAVIGEAARVLPVGGALNATLADLLPVSIPPDSYLQLRADVPVVSLALFRGPETYTAWIGQKTVWTRSLTGPHFFSSSDGGRTRIQLINRNSGSLELTLNLYSDEGESLGSRRFQLDEGAAFAGDVAELCGLPVTGGLRSGYFELALTPIGWLAIYQSELEVVGAVRFSGRSGRSAATLPMVSAGLKNHQFLHVVQSSEAGLFTGLALVNTHDEPTSVIVRAYASTGAQTGEAAFVVAAGHRRIGLLNSAEYFGKDFQQVGGHLEVESGLPLAGFALFGDYRGEFLSAVEGQVPPGETP